MPVLGNLVLWGGFNDCFELFAVFSKIEHES